MPRPCKCRRICSVPRITRFDAAGEPHSEPVTIGLDELEVLRLLDRENLSQQQCAVRMQVSREKHPPCRRRYPGLHGTSAGVPGSAELLSSKKAFDRHGQQKEVIR